MVDQILMVFMRKNAVSINQLVITCFLLLILLCFFTCQNSHEISFKIFQKLLRNCFPHHHFLMFGGEKLFKVSEGKCSVVNSGGGYTYIIICKREHSYVLSSRKNLQRMTLYTFSRC